MEKIKMICKDKKLWIFALITIVFYGALTKLNFMTDTYAVLETSTKEMTNHFIISGRFVTAIFYAICSVLNFKEEIMYILSFVIAIISATFSMYKLYNIIEKEISSEIISMLIAVLIIANLFSIELFLYIEKGILMLSVLFSVLAFEQMTKYFKGKKHSFLYAMLYMLLANFSYQGTVALFVALSLIWIVKYTTDVKSFFKNNIITALCYRNTSFNKLFISKICFWQ